MLNYFSYENEEKLFYALKFSDITIKSEEINPEIWKIFAQMLSLVDVL